MKHLFVPYELALLAKEKEFDEECLMGFYGENTFGKTKDALFLPAGFGKYKNSRPQGHGSISAPIYQQLIDWFRNAHGLVITVYCSPHGFSPDFDYLKEELFKKPQPNTELTTWDYYEALNKALEEAFKLI